MAHLQRHTHQIEQFSILLLTVFAYLNTFQSLYRWKKGLILTGSLHDSHSAIIHWAQEIIFPSISSFLMQPNRIWVPSFRNQFDLTNDSKSDIRPSCNLQSSQHVRGEILFFLKLLHQNFQEIQEMMDLHRVHFYDKRMYSFISWSHQNQTNQIIFLNQKFLYWNQKMGRIWLLDGVCLGGETF